MKKIKISLAAVLALILGIAATAFTVPHSPKTLTDGWYNYNGGPKDDAASYTFSSTDPGCDDFNALCAIRVQTNGTHPDQDALTALYNNTDGFSSPIPNQVEFKP